MPEKGSPCLPLIRVRGKPISNCLQGGYVMPVYSQIANSLEEGKSIALATIIQGDGEDFIGGKKILCRCNELLFSEVSENAARRIMEKVDPLFAVGESGIIQTDNAKGKPVLIFTHLYKAQPRLLIFGGGHVGAALCRIAAHLDFEVIVTDDRPAFANETVHPAADRVICDRFDRAFQTLKPLSSDFVVIVTRGHKHDRACLEMALSYKPAYIGMIGSRSRVRAQLKDMVASGISEDELNRVHSPIGLKIGAVTESEIAISILAEVIQVRRSAGRDEGFQKDVLMRLLDLEQSGGQAVLATIISVRGSTPRKTGSQIIIERDGSITGTIGGGCAEGEVRREALICFDRSQPLEMVNFSLTADAAADEGMACGGTMDVYLELINHHI